jgi:P27 family predicted phage terminase small subunit
MAGKPIPSAIKKARGTWRADRSSNEPNFVLDENPNPPDHFTEQAKAEWRRIYPELSEKKVLTRVGRTTFEGYCVAYGFWRFINDRLMLSKTHIIKTPNGHLQQHPYSTMAKQWMMIFKTMASELGITPASSCRINGADPADDQDAELLRAVLGDSPPASCAQKKKKRK